MKLRALIISAVALVLAMSFAACGNKEDKVLEGDNEGIYIDVSGLTYQVQVSRELNPKDIEDQAYLKGLPPGTPPLAANESYFAVFLKVWNDGDEPFHSAEDFRVVDTQYTDGKPCEPENGCFTPIPLDTTINQFAYTSTQVDPGEQYPPPSSTAYEGVVAGSVLIFRIPYASYDNRPLDLKFKSSASTTEGAVRLDL
jgi:hypothetical protein